MKQILITLALIAPTISWGQEYKSMDQVRAETACTGLADQEDLLKFIAAQIGAEDLDVADWIARQVMEPEMFASLLGQNPVLAAAMKTYDDAKWYSQSNGCPEGRSASTRNR